LLRKSPPKSAYLYLNGVKLPQSKIYIPTNKLAPSNDESFTNIRTFVLQYDVIDYQDVLIGEQLKHMVDVMDAKLDRIEINQVYIYPPIYAN